MRLTAASFILASFAVLPAHGQSVISAHSGVVHYVEGSAYLQDSPVEMKFGHFPDMKPNEILRTEDGRAEVLLAPGSFLRLAANSSVKMISNRLSDTKFELLEGEILVESVDFTKDSAAAKVKGNVITVAYKDSTTVIDKPGLYQFDSSPARVRVYEGEALVKTESAQLTLKRGKESLLEGALMAEKFDNKTGDELTRWSSRRSGYLALANVSAAHSMYNDSGDSNAWSSYSGSYLGGWAFNPMFGMYTFVPMGGIGYSPFGFGYYSPYSAGMYSPYYNYGYGGYGYYPGGAYTGGGSSNSSVGGRRAGTGNFGGNSPIRASASSHVGGAPSFSGAGRGASSMAGSSNSGFSNASRGGSSSAGGGFSAASASSGGGMSSASSGGGSRGGGGSAGGGRGK